MFGGARSDFNEGVVAAAMVLAWAALGQRIAPVQLLGALIVVSTVNVLGLRTR